MSIPARPSTAGPATRAVYETYHREIAVRRSWTRADRAVTLVLVGATALGLVGVTLVATGANAPLIASVSPLGLLVGWLMWRDEILTLLGRPAEPRFPTQMLAIAVQADEAAAGPRPFGSSPPRSPRHELR